MTTPSCVTLALLPLAAPAERRALACAEDSPATHLARALDASAWRRDGERRGDPRGDPREDTIVTRATYGGSTLQDGSISGTER